MTSFVPESVVAVLSFATHTNTKSPAFASAEVVMVVVVPEAVLTPVPIEPLLEKDIPALP